MPSKTDRKVADRYVLIATIGRGGMGTVWRAEDTVLKRQVAVKEILLPATLSEADKDSIAERVMREARTAARLNHAAVVTVFDVVKDERHAYIVMELVDAPTLDDEVKENGPLSPEATARVGLDVLSALQAAHSEGITHRDVKPGNVMLLDEGRAKLADFGIAALKGDPKLTATGLILGSPSYMAPEQASKDRSGPESDLWSLGATLYYAVEGEPPFDKGQAIPTLTAVVHDDHRPPSRAGALAPVLESLLSKDPADRPTDSALRALLEDVARGTAPAVSTQEETQAFSPATETRVYAENAAPATGPTSTFSSPSPKTRRKAGPPLWPFVVGLIALLAVAAAMILPNLGSDESPEKAKKDRGAVARDPADDASPSVASEVPAAAEWTAYEGSNGFSIDYPAGWEVVEGSVDGDSVDFRAPEGDRYLRVDWTDAPGPDAAAAWEDSSAAFGSSHGNYEEIRIDETEFAGSDNAAEWEATWTEGADLHMINLGFVTPDGEWGYALNWVAHEDVWAASLADFERAKSTFVAP